MVYPAYDISRNNANSSETLHTNSQGSTVIHGTASAIPGLWLRLSAYVDHGLRVPILKLTFMIDDDFLGIGTHNVRASIRNCGVSSNVSLFSLLFLNAWLGIGLFLLSGRVGSK
jgi:hypothetical protein